MVFRGIIRTDAFNGYRFLHLVRARREEM